jgi:hypothetical protein
LRYAAFGSAAMIRGMIQMSEFDLSKAIQLAFAFSNCN